MLNRHEITHSTPRFPLQSFCCGSGGVAYFGTEEPSKELCNKSFVAPFFRGRDEFCRCGTHLTHKQTLGTPVVVLADLPHRYQGLQVLVGLIWVDVVQRTAVPRVAIGRREINGDLKVSEKVRDKQYGSAASEQSPFILLPGLCVRNMANGGTYYLI